MAIRIYAGGLLCALALGEPALAADAAANARTRGATMAKDLKVAVKRLYYDPAFHGVDLDALFAKAEERIKQATSEGQVGGILAQTMTEFKDSHTYFIPPIRPFDIDYGFQARMVGEGCLILEVETGSDAEGQGLLAGDLLVAAEATAPTRSNFASLWYALNVVLPRPQLKLVVQTGNEPPREITVRAKVEKRRKSIDIAEWFDEIAERNRKRPAYAWRYVPYEKEGVVIARLYTFVTSEQTMEELMKKIRGRRALVLDLRGNPGGSVEALRTFAGSFFKDEIELGAEKNRKGVKPFKSRRPASNRFFEGELVVLIDSGSASAS
jgi:C-terminal processing protease CtpA/Prc